MLVTLAHLSFNILVAITAHLYKSILVRSLQQLEKLFCLDQRTTR